jgi:hypothetical protein
MSTAHLEAVVVGLISTVFLGWAILLFRQGRISSAIGILVGAAVGFAVTLFAAMGVTFTGA